MDDFYREALMKIVSLENPKQFMTDKDKLDAIFVIAKQAVADKAVERQHVIDSINRFMDKNEMYRTQFNVGFTKQHAESVLTLFNAHLTGLLPTLGIEFAKIVAVWAGDAFVGFYYLSESGQAHDVRFPLFDYPVDSLVFDLEQIHTELVSGMNLEHLEQLDGYEFTMNLV